VAGVTLEDYARDHGALRETLEKFGGMGRGEAR
jgi:hypothetical protein